MNLRVCCCSSWLMSLTSWLMSLNTNIELPHPPSDSISSLSFAQNADYLAVGSWDNSVRVYEVSLQGHTQCKATYTHRAPVLSVCWNEEGNRIFSGSIDNTGLMFDATTGQTTQVAQHDGPVKAVKWVNMPHAGVLVTGSWDKTIKYWDIRTPSPIATVQLPERCYTLDAIYPLMVVGTAGRRILTFDLAKSPVVFGNNVSSLMMQTRVVTCCPDKTGFAVGGVEGRVSFNYIEKKNKRDNYSFKCHRQNSSPQKVDQSLVYSVNDINFHPVHGTFSTCGSDGTAHFWDGATRMRLKSFNRASGPIACSAFNRTGSMFACAVSYDWHKGFSGMTSEQPNKVTIYAVKEEDVRKRVAKR
ncbi:WD40-repeat-containing domain protein [Lentinula aff. detonsa]|uniref:WD40-repeat-containing domain protein n=1 Tax=Lentinula aff. detonsa TaxID=2804958 RepID=A0AA38NLQ6_9AGAR|nr:WD40-repeat-containing domain protein [Lentinula aff. detonsa]